MAEREKGAVSAEPKAKQPKASKPSVFARMGKWFRELKSEIKKIVWPSQEQTINNTVVVLAAIFVVGAFIWILDAFFNLSITRFISHFS